ncbi:MAG: DUF4175 family protein [Proteobacteria bacterium]|nr:DUF4175 family protein [Pseudomonadota bacterium]
MSGIEKRLAGWRGEFVRAALLEGSARYAAGLVALIVAAAVLDAALTLPLEARWGVFSALAAASLGGAFWFLARPILAMDARGLLRRAAAAYPELAPFLVSGWELLRENVGDDRTSRALARAHLAQTERVLADKSALPVFAATISKGARKGLAGAALCSGVFMPWLYGHSPGVGRIFAPWREVPLEAWVELSPKGLRGAWGSAVTITAAPKSSGGDAGTAGGGAGTGTGAGTGAGGGAGAGRVLEPGSLTLWLKTGDGPWRAAEWDGEENGKLSFHLAQLTEPTRYQARWRDQRSAAYLLEPVPFPQLANARARVHLPGRLKPEEAVAEVSLEESGGELSFLRGSWIVVHGKPTQPLSRAQLKVSYLPAPVDFKPRGGEEIEAGFPLSEDGELKLELTSKEGVVDPRPVAYRLKAKADEPPKIEILAPAFDVDASPRESLQVTYEAHDDLGLGALSLLYKAPGRPETAVPVARFDKPATDHVAEFEWPLAGLPLGARVEFRLRATDTCVLGAQSGYSKTVTVRLVDFEGAHEKVEEQWIAAQEKLEKVAAKEAAARELLKELSKGGQSAPEEQSLRRALEAKEAELAREWPRAAKELEEFAQAMAKDPYANPGMTETVQALAKDVGVTQREQSPQAAEASRRGEWKRSDEKHAKLEAAAKKAVKLLEKGKEMQGLQDFWSDAQRMDQESQQLSESLSQMSKGKQPSAEDKRKLDQALKNLQAQMEAMAKTIEKLPKPSSDAAADKRKKYVVPLGKAMHTADALQKAMEQGDYAKAAQLAKQLAEELAQVRQAIADAAQSASQSAMSGGEDQDPLSEKMAAAMARWQQTIDEQAKSLEQAQKAADERTKALFEAQKKVLEGLAKRQKAAVERGAALRAVFPPDALEWMKQTLKEFEAGAVSKSPELLGKTLTRLQAQALAFQPAAVPLMEVHATEKAILEELTKGVPPPPMDDAAKARASAAAQSQSRTRKSTGELERQLKEIEAEAGGLPSKTIEPVTQAGQEQDAAVQALERQDAPAGVKREQKALDLLEQGLKEMSSALEQQKRIEEGMKGSFSGARPKAGRRRGGGRTGSDMGHVGLPNKDDYQPTQEMRQELEKSLQEKRSPAYDKVIKDYFKRISQ